MKIYGSNLSFKNNRARSHILQTLQAIQDSRRYNAWIYDRIKNYLFGSVLDIGSGLGDIARQFTGQLVVNVVLSDFDDKMVDALNATVLPFKNYRVMPLDITDPQILKQPATARQFDTVTCVNVLEHIKDDASALRHMKHLLKDNGRIVILVPALPSIYGTLDSLVGHHRRYTKKSLSAVFARAGLTVKDAYHLNFWGIFTWFLAGKVFQKKQFDAVTCRRLDRIVPVLKMFETFGPPPVGQSLIMVGEKSFNGIAS